MSFLKSTIFPVLLLVIAACGESDNVAITHQPVGFNSNDECHVCGMVITRLGGPKGQVFETRTKQMKKFCSTIELFFWYLQPENTPNVLDIYVHDMAQSEWNNPDDQHLIHARNATFVVNSSKKGAMGKTLASFLHIKDAEQFAEKWGGQVVAFTDLSLVLLAQQ